MNNNENNYKIDYKKYWKKGYKINTKHICIGDYEFPKDKEEWLSCPNCGLVPKIWEFNNGRITACGCGKNEYVHFIIEAESIGEHCRNNNNNISNFDSDSLKNNWNHWVKTGKILYNLKEKNE